MAWFTLPDWLTGYDAENAERARRADAEIRRLNVERYTRENGYTQAQLDRIQQDFNTDDVFTTDDAALAAIDQQFVEGLAEGRDNVKGFFNGAVFELLKSIPLVVWLGGAVAVFVWLGGLTLLKGRLGR